MCHIPAAAPITAPYPPVLPDAFPLVQDRGPRVRMIGNGWMPEVLPTARPLQPHGAADSGWPVDPLLAHLAEYQQAIRQFQQGRAAFLNGTTLHPSQGFGDPLRDHISALA